MKVASSNGQAEIGDDCQRSLRTSRGDGRLRLSGDAVALYRYVVAHPRWSPEQAEVGLQMDGPRLEAATQELRSSRLLRRTNEDRGSWDPVAPECALVDLLADEEERVHREQVALNTMRAELLSLQPVYLEALGSRAMAEAIDVAEEDGGVIAKFLNEFVRRASTDISIASTDDGLHGSDWLRAFELTPVHPVHGRNVRILLNHAARTRPGFDRLAERAGSIRTIQALPLCVALFDNTVAIVTGNDRTRGALAVVRHPAVVGALRVVFDTLWESGRSVVAAQSWHDDRLRLEILRQLASGHKDEVVARRLGLSVRTCRRHIAGIMEDLGATSRFQAGLLAARGVLRDYAATAVDVFGDRFAD